MPLRCNSSLSSSLSPPLSCSANSSLFHPVVMLSTFPHASPYESMLENPFPVFDAASTLWEGHEYLPALFQLPEPARLDMFKFNSPKPVISSSSSENQEEPESFEPGLEEPGLEEPGDKVQAIDERKRRRMESNRESARRSRKRKQKHLENLRSLVNKLRVENRELSNQLRFTVYQMNHVRTENDHLQTEHSILRQKFLYIRQALNIQQISAPNFTQSQFILNYNKNNLINC